MTHVRPGRIAPILRRASWLPVLFAITLGALSLGVASHVDAQERPILIVPFEREQVDDDFYQRFMAQVHSDADQSAEYTALPVVDQTLNDLLFAVGCDAPEPDCMQLIGESFGAEVIMHGSLWRNDRTTLETVNLFDVTTGESVLDVPIEETFTVEDPSELFNVCVATVQQVFFPFSGTVTVTTSKPGAEISFDGSGVGSTTEAALELTGRPLGLHSVTARLGDVEVTKQVVLVHGTPTVVEIDMTPPATSGPSEYGHLFSYVVLGVGGASLIGGGVFSVLTDSANSRAKELDLNAKPNLSKDEAKEIDDLLQSGGDYEFLQWVFYGVGSAAIVTGAIMYYFEGSGPEASSESAGRTLIAPIVTPDGGFGAAAVFTF